MLEKIIDKIKNDFDSELLETVVHELSHAIFGAMNDYEIKSISFLKQINHNKIIDGKVDICFSHDKKIIEDLCSNSDIVYYGRSDDYRRIGSFYIELLLIGYVAEQIYLGKKWILIKILFNSLIQQ